MKKSIAITLLITMLFMVFFAFGSSTLATDAIIPGDIDFDGRVTPRDARWALRLAAKLETVFSPDERLIAADVDKNGTIDATDSRIILRWAAELG